jgi:hypothetical protein
LKPQTPRERPCVQSFHAERAAGFQKGLERTAAAPVARRILIFPDDEAFKINPGGLHILVIDAGVADQRIGHRHDLTLVGRIGEDLLVAGHAGVENRLAQHLARAGKSGTGINTPIFQYKNSW